MSASLEKKNLLKIFNSILYNNCPICSSHLNYDNQNDSIYISCLNRLNHFEISGFKDLESGNLILLYLNNYKEGIVDTSLLKEFQNVMYRKIYSD